MAGNVKKTADYYPEGEQGAHYVRFRQRTASTWAIVFMASTLIGIVALTALLYNVVNSAFGYVMVQNEVDPGLVAVAAQKEVALGAANTTASEDDEELAAGVAADPHAIGFFGYAYLQEHQDTLRAVTVDGVAPTAATVQSGEYPLARPLYLYTSAAVLKKQPQVAAFLRYYLDHVNDVAAEAGYFPVAAPVLAEPAAALAEAAGEPLAPAAAEGPIRIAGSSTVYPLTRQLAADFADQGFRGAIELTSGGTLAGIEALCKGRAEIALASRPMSRMEREDCRKVKRGLIEIPIAQDALAVVVSRENTFLQDVTAAQLGPIFSTAANWSDVDGAWPDAPIARFIPGADSGTLDVLVGRAFPTDLAALPKATLQRILEQNVSAGLMRRLEDDLPFAERTQEDVYALVVERVVNRKIIQSWSLVDSIFHKPEIDATVAKTENAQLIFRSWLTTDFVTGSQSPNPEFAGVRTAIFGSLWVILITILFSLPIGVGAAVYLEEYARPSRINRLIETNINNLAGVPSIIYGMLGLAIFVRMLEPLTSGSLFGVGDPTTSNGRTILAAGLTLGLLILPLIIINAREAVRAVPGSLRQASYGLGATKWQTTWHHVLPSALPGILTGTILAISRAIGETAPLVVIGASTFIVVDPNGPFSKFTTLPIQIYQWTARPQAEFRNLAAAAIIVLLILLLSLNATAVILRNRFGGQRA